jgi:hypothetical protein
MKTDLKLKALIALALILVSGLASSNVVSNSNVLRVSNAYDPPSFGIESSGFTSEQSTTSVTYSLTTINPNDTIIVYLSTPNEKSDDNLNVSDSLGVYWNERFNDSWADGQVAEFWTQFNNTVTSDTLNATQTQTDTLEMNVVVIQGADTTYNPFDDGNNSLNPTFNTGTGTSATTTLDSQSQSPELVFGFIAKSGTGTYSSDSPFVKLIKDNTYAPYSGIEVNETTSLNSAMTVGYTLGSSEDWAMFADAVVPCCTMDDPTYPTYTGPIQHVILIMMENKSPAAVFGTKTKSGAAAAPYITSLASSYTNETKWYPALCGASGEDPTCSSLPQYIDIAAGWDGCTTQTTSGCGSNGIPTDYDCNYSPCSVGTAGHQISRFNIFKYLENNGKTWTNYAESMTSGCEPQNNNIEYAVRHTIPVWFSDLNSVCSANQVPLGTVTAWNKGSPVTSGPYGYGTMTGDFATTLTDGNLSSFTVISPNLWDDMHTPDSGNVTTYGTKTAAEVKQGDVWLSTVVPYILYSKDAGTTLIIITWDTGTTNKNVATILIAPSNALSYGQKTSKLNHFSIGRTLEVIFHLNNNYTSTSLPDIGIASAIPSLKQSNGQCIVSSC